MIRDKIYRDITQTLDKHARFDSTEFKVSTVRDQRGNSTTLTIEYSIEPKYRIVFKIPSSTVTEKNEYGSLITDYSFSGTVCPGPLALDETFSFRGEDGIFERITTWLNNIWEELSANPIVKKMESQQTQIDELFERFDSMPDDYFSVEEAAELKERLNNLEETLKATIQERVEDKKVFEQEVAKLHTDIDTLKQTITSFKKKGWLKSFTNKVFKWTSNSDNRKLLKDGYSIIREFLPEDVKHSLPN